MMVNPILASCWRILGGDGTITSGGAISVLPLIHVVVKYNWW